MSIERVQGYGRKSLTLFTVAVYGVWLLCSRYGADSFFLPGEKVELRWSHRRWRWGIVILIPTSDSKCFFYSSPSLPPPSLRPALHPPPLLTHVALFGTHALYCSLSSVVYRSNIPPPFPSHPTPSLPPPAASALLF